MRLLKREKDALAALLVEGAESPEDLVESFVKKLDELRGTRTHSYACMIVAGIPLAIGPFATDSQAERAAKKLGAEKLWVVGGWTPEGWANHLAELDKAPEPLKLNAKEKAAREKGFWSKVSRVRDGEVTAITGKVEIKPLVTPGRGYWG